jgi:hypothetical protein
MFGDFLHEENDCYDLSPKPMNFLEGHLSQLAVSSASATCYMEQIGISHVGAIDLTKDSLNKIMNTTLHGGSEKELFLNTTSLAKHLTVF